MPSRCEHPRPDVNVPSAKPVPDSCPSVHVSSKILIAKRDVGGTWRSEEESTVEVRNIPQARAQLRSIYTLSSPLRSLHPRSDFPSEGEATHQLLKCVRALVHKVAMLQENTHPDEAGP